MRAARGGDRVAVDVLLRRHHDRIYAICRRLTGNPADAADACQEALLSIVRGLRSFDGRSQFTTWAHRVATNATLDELRRRSRRAAASLPEDRDDVGLETPDPGPAHADATANRVTVDDALAQLPDEFRIPVVLRDLVGHDYAEIAELLGIPPGTVRSRISRGRSRLAELLGNQAAPADRPTTRP